jgi:hypothetical protein
MVPNLAELKSVQRELLEVMLAVAASVVPLCVAASANSSESRPALRCGWFDNPTPGNAWLTDRDGEWIVGIQGGHQAEGDWPEFKKSEWISTNRSYGYGCACIKLIAERGSREVREILSSKSRPLGDCRNDKRLPKRKT